MHVSFPDAKVPPACRPTLHAHCGPHARDCLCERSPYRPASAQPHVAKAAEAIDHPGFDWDVRVIQNDKPNAFCLPGGKIVIFTGIVPYAKNEAGLAAVIAHEVGHAVARHGGERLSQRLALQGALAIGGEAIKGKDGKLDARTRLILGGSCRMPASTTMRPGSSMVSEASCELTRPR
ncbi:MAG: M48 family metallopeptidase [Deltaproteobacteria bacterium]